MSHIVEKIPLKSSSPGTCRFLTVHKFIGDKAGPKVYLQAALHADEWPGLLTLQHLLAQLIELEQQNKINGEIILVPYANPIGMSQKINGVVLGRQSFSAEGNFNRNWPDFASAVSFLQEQVSQPSVEQVKSALREEVQKLPRHTPLNELKATLLSLSIDADIVLDLHCDSVALVHIYSNYRHQAAAELLAAYIRSPVVLLEDEPGGSAFDAAHILPWVALEHTGMAHSCFSATVELRGFADVNDDFARQDAAGLLAFLGAQKAVQIADSERPVTAVLAADLAAVDSVMAPSTGIFCLSVCLGDKVAKGQAIGEIVNIEADDPAHGRVKVYSRTRGILFAINTVKLVCEGDNIAKIAGTELLENTTGGSLLTL
ncbi:MAG: hypothetical protein OFPII_02320 [Osedax symbiont Rs1]|nr:MAG: hypothetical protein OFPII_02320 [Osedax symbiont Rs1]